MERRPLAWEAFIEARKKGLMSFQKTLKNMESNKTPGTAVNRKLVVQPYPGTGRFVSIRKT